MQSSIFDRYIFSAGTNVVRAILSFFAGILIAKGLGVQDYGVYSFLIASFGALLSILDLGTSNAFFTFISKKNQSRYFFAIFLFWILFIFLLSVLLLIFILPDSWLNFIWLDSSRKIIFLAFTSIFLKTYFWNIVIQIAESQRLTKLSQSLSLLITATHFILIIVLLLLESLSISLIFYLIIIEFLVGIIIAYILFPISFSDNRKSNKDIVLDYWTYCLPLIPYIFLQMVMKFSDTWLLQEYGGAEQQAYYALAMQFSVVCILATSSFIKILWKEVAEANEQKNNGKVENLYFKSTRILFVGATVFCCFLSPLAPEIIELTLGASFLPGAFVMSLMFLYPIHQTIGQINGSMYFSLGMTKMHSFFGILFMIFSTFLVYFLLAPSFNLIPGLGLGALGVAIKMLVMQLIFTSVTSWYLCFQNKWSYRLTYQILYPVLFFSLSFCCNIAAYKILGMQNNPFYEITLSLVIYFSIVILILYKNPKILGLNKEDFKKILLSIGISV